MKGRSGGMTLSKTNPYWGSDVFIQLRYYPGKHWETLFHAARKAMAVYCGSISRLGNKGVCIWKTKDPDPLENGRISRRDK